MDASATTTTLQSLALVGAALLGAALAAGLMFWWLYRKLRAAGARVEHLEQSRQQVSQQVAAARRQVEQLQRELAELRLSGHVHQGDSRPPRPAQVAPAAEPAREVFLPLPAEAAPQGKAQARDPFAPTQIMPRR